MSAPTPVTMTIIRAESGSIHRPNDALKRPAFIHDQSGMSTKRLASGTPASPRKTSSAATNDAETASEATSPEPRLSAKRQPTSAQYRKPSSGKSSVSVAVVRTSATKRTHLVDVDRGSAAEDRHDDRQA